MAKKAMSAAERQLRAMVNAREEARRQDANFEETWRFVPTYQGHQGRGWATARLAASALDD